MKNFYLKHKSIMDILLTYLSFCAVIALVMLVWALREGAEVWGFYLFGALFGLVQLPFCFKPKKVAVKLIPVYFLLVILLLAYFNYLQGGLGGELAALILAILAFVLACGCVLAWLTFAIVRFRERKTKK